MNDDTESLWPVDLGTPQFKANAYRWAWKDELGAARAYQDVPDVAKQHIKRAKRFRRYEVEALAKR